MSGKYMYNILSGRTSKKERMIKMENKNESKNTVPFPIDYKVSVEAGSMLLIDILYEQGKINKATYDNIQKKYGNKNNKESEGLKHEK